MRNIVSPFVAAVVAALLFTSCKSLRNINSKDTSTKSASTYKKKKRNVTFIDGVEVKPGDVTSSRQTTKSSSTGNRKVVYSRPDILVPDNFSIEQADWLQLKYAIMLNETVENLLNLSLLKTIDGWWGTRYCIGGNTTNCTDCSGFTQVVMRDAYGVQVPRIAQEQYDESQRVNLENLQQGDLVFFYTGGREISHVGVYLSNNKFVHASTSNGVMISDLNDTYWKPRYRGAGRFSHVASR
jgi:hypothetical protein